MYYTISNIQPSIQSPVESPMESPIESPVESPVESSVESPIESPVESPNSMPPYSLYWTRYKEPCPNKSNSFFELNMKRKALTLQYKNTHTQQKKTAQYIKAVKNQNRMNNRSNKQTSVQHVCNKNNITSATQSNVPGYKGFILYDSSTTPVYNYIPVKAYQGEIINIHIVLGNMEWGFL